MKNEELQRRKSEDLVVLECELCGHIEQAREAQLRPCPICGGPLREAPGFEFEEEERRETQG